MKCASVAFAIVALGTGLVAAWYWLKASKIEVAPLSAQYGLSPSGLHDANQDDWITGIMVSVSGASRLNAIAAKWTAAAVVAGCLSTLSGAWPLWACWAN